MSVSHPSTRASRTFSELWSKALGDAGEAEPGFARDETASPGQTRSVDETGTTVIFASRSCSCLRDMTNTGRALSPWPDLAAMG